MLKYRESDRTFVNPYHFVPMEDGNSPTKDFTSFLKRDYEEECNTNAKLLTGWIECKIVTKTPVFIPNTTNDDVFKERTRKPPAQVIHSYDFFSYRDLSNHRANSLSKPVIPGSSIRGVIRSAYETVTNSCLSTTDFNKRYFRRAPFVGLPGRLNKNSHGKWIIEPCTRYGISIKKSKYDDKTYEDFVNNCKEGSEVFFNVGGKVEKKGRTLFEYVTNPQTTSFRGFERMGYLHKGEHIEMKHHESIFCPNDAENIVVEDSAVDNLLLNYEYYQTEKINDKYKKDKKDPSRKHGGYESSINTSVEKSTNSLKEQLIYYTKHNDHYYLCPAAIGREVFYTTLEHLIPKHLPCSMISELCPACLLFGVAKGSEAVSSRISFSDAHYTGRKNLEEIYDKPGILRELASPKPSCSEFYLQQQDPQNKTWNYDYAVLGYSVENGKIVPTCSNNYEPARILGRKYYWHHNYDTLPYIDEQKATIRNVKIRPLKKETEFEFRINFRNVFDTELNTLLWCLTFGDSSQHAHKIGMGKPIGLGSIGIELNKVLIRNIPNGNLEEYEIKECTREFKEEISGENLDWLLDSKCSPKTLRAYLKITDFDGKPKEIQYPNNIDNAEGSEHFKWFGANKGNNPFKPKIQQSLGILDENNKIKLNKYERE